MSTALYVDAGIQASKVFDYCITLEAESQWVWHRKWTFVRFIFTVSRYLPFFGIGMTFVAALRTQYYPGESCVGYGQASTGLLMTRIYASWSSKRLMIFLLVFSIVSLCGMVLISATIDSDSSWAANPGDCLFLSGRNNVFSYAVLLLHELVLSCLMLFIRFRRYGHTVGLLQRTFFHDTMKYMICITIMSSFSILLTMLAPVCCVPIVIHSVLASRIHFNLRASEGRSGIQPQVEISEIQVSSDTIRFEGS
ncbi:hypothetical protein EDD22DRAFT_894604 [Suillus occidentalis]|nr:hypothetical protein EDD22DRAFT_894604 [Suillus occidentalis]